MKKMNAILTILAVILEQAASLGAGLASFGIGYEPEVPEELRK